MENQNLVLQTRALLPQDAHVWLNSKGFRLFVFQPNFRLRLFRPCTAVVFSLKD